MGLPKQLLPWRGATLVRHAAEQAVNVADAGVFAVVGASAQEVTDRLSGLSIKNIYHPGFAEGLGSSLAAGVRGILAGGDAELYSHILIQLADQPAVTTSYLEVLIGEARRWDGIVATRYPVHAGVPAVFPARYFPDLLTLGGDAGAGKLLNSGGADVRLIQPPFELFDIDTPEDYRRHEGDS